MSLTTREERDYKDLNLTIETESACRSQSAQSEVPVKVLSSAGMAAKFIAHQ